MRAYRVFPEPLDTVVELALDIILVSELIIIFIHWAWKP